MGPLEGPHLFVAARVLKGKKLGKYQYIGRPYVTVNLILCDLATRSLIVRRYRSSGDDSPSLDHMIVSILNTANELVLLAATQASLESAEMPETICWVTM